MMNTPLKSLRNLSVLSLTVALAACSGGGGGGSTPPAPVPPPPTGPVTELVAPAGTLQASAAPASYGGASIELSAFSALESARASAGAGYLNQSAQLDVAAAAHAAYITANIGDGLVHVEDPAKTAWYENTVASRATKAGYAFSYVTEVIGGSGASMTGADCVRGMLNTVYHAAAMLSHVTDVGVGFGTDAASVPLCVLKLGTPTASTYGQVPATGSLMAYPYDTQTNVYDTFYVAYETPRPSITLFPNLTTGTPVLVNVRNAEYVNYKAAGQLAAVVSTFRLVDGGGNVVPSAIVANSDLTGGPGVTLNADGNLGEGFAVLVPLSPLAKNVTYTATFTATLRAGGTPVTKTWSFTTNP